jgi:hypothetical protein
MNVDIKNFKKVIAYLALLESVPLEEITWVNGDKPIEISKEKLKEWKFTGLNNRDFGIMEIIKDI